MRVNSRENLKKIIQRGKLASAYLFLGPKGSGKKEAALFFAEELAEKTNTLKENLIFIEPEVEEKNGRFKKKEIGIEKIRELQHKLSLRFDANGLRVTIINEAEKLSQASQNALLKTLEEPFLREILVLISGDEKRILPTVFSRCQKVRFNLPIQTLSQSKESKKNAGEFYQAKNWEEVQTIFRGNLRDKFSLAEKWSLDSSNACHKLDILVIFLRLAMLGEKIGENISQEKSLRMIENIEMGKRLLRETNSNARLVLENLFLKI